MLFKTPPRMEKNKNRVVLFEFHLKFWYTNSIGIPARSLLKGRQTSNWSNCSTRRNSCSMVFKYNISRLNENFDILFILAFYFYEVILEILCHSLTFIYPIWDMIFHEKNALSSNQKFS